MKDLRIELSIECREERLATALNTALMPDNRYFPKDQRFEAAQEGSVVRFRLESPRVRPAISTIASLVSDAELFAQVWAEAAPLGAGARPRREAPTPMKRLSPQRG